MSFLENKGSAASKGLKSGGTFSEQESVPQLPVPDLEETCAKYLQWVRPIVDDATFSITKANIEKFKTESGPALHAALQQRAKRRDQPSWLHKWWQDSYLATRCPNAININYGLLLNDLPQFSTADDWLGVAAALTLAAANFKILLDREEFPPQKERGKPICMSQFKKLFGTTRIPLPQQDELRSTFPSPSRHILVVYHGNLAVLDVITVNNKPHTYNQILTALGDIVEALDRPTPCTNVCALTGVGREDWAAVRFQLFNLSTQNVEALALVDSALFALSLDDNTYPTLQLQTKASLHGNGCNRWFDSCFTLWVSRDAHAGLNGEHSWGDGHTTMSTLDWMMDWLRQYSPASLKAMQATRSGPYWQHVQFQINGSIHNGIVKAITDISVLIADTLLEVVEFTKFGAEGIKKLKVSPDAFVQAAMNSAQLPAFGAISSCYESAMTKAFNHGRTEAMRPVTPELVSFAHALFSSAASPQEKLHKLQAAAKAHTDRMLQCKEGKGVERLFYGLQMIYAEQGAELGLAEPTFFQDPAFRKLKHDTLSTSSLPSTNLKSFCFGPVVDDGLGLGYQVIADRIVITVSARAANVERQAIFCREVTKVLEQMAALLSTAQNSKL